MGERWRSLPPSLHCRSQRSRPMPSKDIVDSRLFVRVDLSDANHRNERFSDDRANLAHLASQLLLYDRVLIPTHDFGIIPILLSWIGFDLLEELLSCNAIGFVRRRGLLGYAGNGNAVSVFRIERRERPLLWWQQAIFEENQTAADLQTARVKLHQTEQQSLVDRVLEQTINLAYTNDFFIEHIANESYRDVMASAALSSYVWRSSEKRDDRGVDLRWLPQIRGDQMRVLRADGSIKDPVDLVLRTAEVNMELLMASQAGGADLFTTEGADRLLREKLHRAGATESMLRAFMGLLELNSLPDIRPALSAGEIAFDRVWELRNSSEAIQLRAWLRAASPADSRELERAYVAAISKEPTAARWPMKAIRIMITAAFGLIPGVGGLLAGIGADVVDSFFVDRWINGFSPKLFVDELQKLAPEGTSEAE